MPVGKYHLVWIIGVRKCQISFEVFLVRLGFAREQRAVSDEKFLDHLARSRTFGTIRSTSGHIGVKVPKKIERAITDRCLKGFPR